jgi:hypothetical protein
MHIYKITNLINQKVYIGQTVQKNPMMRWYSRLADARRGKKREEKKRLIGQGE